MLHYRKASQSDVSSIVALLVQDNLAQARQYHADECHPRYPELFQLIDRDPNQYLLCACLQEKIIGTCHLNLMPSLTFSGTIRLQIEAVRIDSAYRGQGYGEEMMQHAIQWGQKRGASLIQLMTHKSRDAAQRFYRRLGFQESHIGMKLLLDSV